MIPVLEQAKILGEGDYRRVYQHPHRPGLVVKSEKHNQAFCNVVEWLVWNQARGTDLEPWLARCEYISPCGRVLYQQKLNMLTPDSFGGNASKHLPSEIPAALNNLRITSWGIAIGDPVPKCCDYGSINILPEFRLREVDWNRAEWADIVQNSEEFNYGKV
jgi:hypothetical protein